MYFVNFLIDSTGYLENRFKNENFGERNHANDGSKSSEGSDASVDNKLGNWEN